MYNFGHLNALLWRFLTEQLEDPILKRCNRFDVTVQAVADEFLGQTALAGVGGSVEVFGTVRASCTAQPLPANLRANK